MGQFYFLSWHVATDFQVFDIVSSGQMPTENGNWGDGNSDRIPSPQLFLKNVYCFVFQNLIQKTFYLFFSGQYKQVLNRTIPCALF